MTRFGASSVRSRLLLLVLLAILPAVALIVVTAWEQRQLAALEAQDAALRITRLVADQQARLVEGARPLLLALAHHPAVQAADARACSAFAAELARRSTPYANIGAAAPDGHVFCSAAPTERASLAGRPHFLAARDRREVSTSSDLGAGGGQPLLSLAAPALDRAGTLRAVVFASLTLAWLVELAERTPLPETAEVLVTDASGTVVFRHPDGARWTGQTLPDSSLTRALRRGERHGRAEGLGADSVPRFFAYAPLAGAPAGEPLFVLAGIAKDSTYAGAERVLLRNLFALGLVAVLALGVTALVGHLIIFRRLQRLMDAARRLSMGDLASRAGFRGGDEIGALAEAFDGMAERLGAMVRREQDAKANLSERVTELDLLNRLGELLQACLTIEEACVVMQRMVPQFFPTESGAVFLTSASRTVLESVTAWGPGTMTPGSVFGPDECWALRTGRTHVVEDTRGGLLCHHLPHPQPATYVCVPLVAQNEALGMMTLGRPAATGGPRPVLAEARRRLAEAVAEHLALGLANVKLREVLRGQSIRDPLTGLFNRRYMEETLEREVRRAQRSGRPMAVVMVDLDHFKDVNDSVDHDAGDAVLRAVGQFLQRNLRREDIACRYGGDEFVLVLTEASFDDALRRAEQLREGAKLIRIADRGRELGPVSLSIGLAAFPQHGAHGDALLRAADTALLVAKREGRDRVAVGPAPTPEPAA